MAQQQIEEDGPKIERARVIFSQKGAKMLYDELNHVYRSDGQNKDKSKKYWRCTNTDCNARIHTPGYICIYNSPNQLGVFGT